MEQKTKETELPCHEPPVSADPAPQLAPGVVITHEDIDRAHDRERVVSARARHGIFSRLRLLWLLVGPGILVMLGENDGPSMLSYAATGSRFGVGFFVPFVVLTFVMALIVQEMTVRLGSATHRGHAELIFDRFGPFWGWFSMIDLGIGNFLTLITEFIAIRAGLGFFGVPPWAAILSALAVLYLALVTHRYWTWERITLAAAAFNLVFVPVALLARPNWSSIAHALITWTPLPGGLTRDTVLILLADIGATVTPWMLFFQQSATVDKGLTKGDVRFGRIDTALGAGLAAIAAVATILATAPLFAHHMSAENFQAAEFAQALVPLIDSAQLCSLWGSLKPAWSPASLFQRPRLTLLEKWPTGPTALTFLCGRASRFISSCSCAPWPQVPSCSSQACRSCMSFWLSTSLLCWRCLRRWSSCSCLRTTGKSWAIS
jgi:hypothetical protein